MPETPKSASHDLEKTASAEQQLDVLPVDASSTSSSTIQPAHSVWTTREKVSIILLTSLASSLSPFSANVYFPVIPQLAEYFHTDVEHINLTVTAFLVLQGLSPMVVGALADHKGRRVAYLVCLVLLCVSCVGLALVPRNAFWLLIVLRCAQSAGSAPTVSIGYGVISDISTPGERGTLVAVATIAPLLGPAIGPIIGGAIGEHFGWRGIFWFLAIASACAAIAVFLFLPETLRSIVGAGDIPPPAWLRPPIPLLTRYTSEQDRSDAGLAPEKRAPLAPAFLREPDVLILLCTSAAAYAVFQALMSSSSPILTESYSYLTETTVGLCYLAVAGGATFGGMLNGKIQDAEYRRNGGTKGTQFGPEFPIERARLRLLPFFIAAGVAAIVGYGWSVGRTTLAVPLICQFMFGWVTAVLFNTFQTLLLDLLPGQGASVTAANNLFRCLLGAGVVAAMEAIRRELGTGWLFVILGGGGAAIMLPLLVVARIFGPRWRETRRLRKQAQE